MHPDGCPCGQCDGFGALRVGGFAFEWPTTWTLGDLSAVGLIVLAGLTVYREFFGKGRR